MTAWRSKGKRGDVLEDLILYSNDYYRSHQVARVDKAATPVTVVEINDVGQISKAYFEKKSTVDFYGLVQGLFITFDAKETYQKSFPLKNLHDHQVAYMKEIDQQGGLAFLIVHFKFNDTYYMIPYELLAQYYEAAKNKGRKSIPFDAMQEGYLIERLPNGVLHYLKTLNHYIDAKNNPPSHT